MVDTQHQVPLTNFHRGDIIDSKDLPLRYTTYTNCFRAEAGGCRERYKGTNERTSIWKS